MTPLPPANRETDSTETSRHLDELCHAIDGERAESHQSRSDCVEDCTEHPKPFPCD